MKRVYKEVSLVALPEGWQPALDGKPLRTPGGRALLLTRIALAEAIAAEWRAQGEEILPAAMPLTQLASTALDRIATARPAIVDQLVAYGASDLLCYRAGAPEDLVERQRRAWDPLLLWAEAALGAPLVTTTGVLPVAQPAASLERLRARLDGYDDFRLSGVQSAVAALGSLVLGLALAERHLSAEEAFALSQLDETYQSELWGLDREAEAARHSLFKDISAAFLFINLYESEALV